MSNKNSVQDTNAISSWERRKLYAASLKKPKPPVVKEEKKGSVKRKLEEDLPMLPNKRLNKSEANLARSQKRKREGGQSRQPAKKMRPALEEKSNASRPGASAKGKPDHSPPPPSSSAAATALPITRNLDPAAEEPVAKPKPLTKPLSRIEELKMWKKKKEEERKQPAAGINTRRMTFGARPPLQPAAHPSRRATLDAKFRPGGLRPLVSKPVTRAFPKPGQANSVAEAQVKKAPNNSSVLMQAKATQTFNRRSTLPLPAIKKTIRQSAATQRQQLSKSVVAKPVSRPLTKKGNQQNVTSKPLAKIKKESEPRAKRLSTIEETSVEIKSEAAGKTPPASANGPLRSTVPPKSQGKLQKDTSTPAKNPLTTTKSTAKSGKKVLFKIQDENMEAGKALTPPKSQGKLQTDTSTPAKNPLTATKSTAKSGKKVLFKIQDENMEAGKKPLALTPHKSLTLRGRLEAWLEQGGRSIKNHCHLRCFSSQKPKETPASFPLHNKTLNDSEILELSTLDVGASPQLKPKKTPSKAKTARQDILVVDSLLEIKELLKAQSLDSPGLLLGSIAEAYPDVENLPLYWEVRAMAAENVGEHLWGLELLHEAVERNVGPFTELAAVVERFLLRTKTPRRPPLADHSNLPPITPREDRNQNVLKSTPLRRSTRIAQNSAVKPSPTCC